MQIIWCTYRKTSSATTLNSADVATIHDAVWALAPPRLGLEHVTVVPAADEVALAFFLNQAAADPIPQIQSLFAKLSSNSGAIVLADRA
jgi:hypothetical protein